MLAHLKDAVAMLFILAFVGGLLLVLWLIVRFSIISPMLTRGAGKRLREPDPTGVEKICGFPPPPALVEMYRTAPFMERGEFRLVDLSTEPPARWEFYEFIPLTARDLREARKVSHCNDGIPFALDSDGGAYVALPDGRVVLRSSNVAGGEVLVAASAEHFATFGTRRKRRVPEAT